MLVAIAGIVIIGIEQGLGTTPLAFALVIGAAIFWSMSNIAQRQAQPPDIFRFMVWISVIPPVPLLLLSAMTEDFGSGMRALASMSTTALGTALYVAWISTLFGFGAWGYLLRAYPASSVAPYSLLVPIFGMSTAAVVLNEQITASELLAAVLIIVGVAITALPKRRKTTPLADPLVPAAPS
jgi:O-acetylserine/cysteine efflux transporter